MDEQTDDFDLAAMTSVPVRRVVWKTRDGKLGSEERRALLDALDAVPRVRRDGIDDHSHVPAQAAHDLLDRAERAERERDEQRVLIDALANRECAGAYLCVGRGVSGRAFSPCEPCAARRLQAGEGVSDAESFRGGVTPRAALSADADADAEREAWGERSCATCGEHVPWEGTKPHGEGRCNTDAEPSRAEGSEPDWPDCHTCNGTGALWIGDNEYVCKDCTAAPGTYALVGQPSPSPRYDAEGGRPREADPQGPSNGSGDASVDGGGDDGRSRAIDAAFEQTPLRLEECVSAIDAALASGGVVTREDWLHERWWGNQRVEVALRDLLYAKRSLAGGECPHCGNGGCYRIDDDAPLGVMRCATTGLAVISSIARGDIHQPLWDRARAALEDSDG